MRQIILIFEFGTLSFAKIAPFKEMIRKYGSYAFITSNSCMIWTNSDVVAVRNYLMTGIGSDDKLFVGEVSAPAAWTNSVPKEVSDYIIKNLKQKTF